MAINIKNEYQKPYLGLLDDTDDLTNKNNEEIEKNIEIINTTFANFGVRASVIGTVRGCSVTRYEISPAPGTRINKVKSLISEVELSLACGPINLVNYIPGKPAIGFDVPNKTKTLATLKEVVSSDEFKNSESVLTCALGKDMIGNNVMFDLRQMPHLLIAGTTGSGKSVCMHSLIMSILFKSTPDEVKLLLIDPKMVEFTRYNGIGHLLVPVIKDAKRAAGALSWAVDEMMRRYKVFAEFDCKNISMFNELVDRSYEYEKDTGEILEVNGLKITKEKIPDIVIFIDEIVDLIIVNRKEVEKNLCRLAQMARAAGIHLVVATQKPSSEYMSVLIKSNLPSKIAFNVFSKWDSRSILDMSGAEKLSGNGDMLFLPVGKQNPERVQGCFVSDNEINRVVDFIKIQGATNYSNSIENVINKYVLSCDKTQNKNDFDYDDEYDPMLEDALEPDE